MSKPITKINNLSKPCRIDAQEKKHKKTVILLAPFKYYYKNRLSKYIWIGSVLCIEQCCYKALQKIFTKVIGYDYLKRLSEIGITGTNEEVIDLVKKEHPDYVIWLTSGGHEFRELTFDSIRKEGAIVIAFFFDDEYCFDGYSKWWIPHLDYSVTNDIRAVPKYRDLQAKCILAVPIGGGIAVDRDWSNLREKYDVSFVGHRESASRKQYLSALQKRNIPICLFGGDREGGFISIEEMLNVYWSSKINLNFSKTKLNRLQLKGRIFEVCLAGGFLLTEYVPGLENYFEIDKEIVCFRNPEEMIDKIIYYLSHEKERRAIAQAGWKRAITNYSSFHVLSKMFKEIEEDIAMEYKEESPSFLLKMSKQVRENFSDYYFRWGLAFAMLGYKKLWKDALSLSLSYNRFNVRAWYFYLIGFSPPFIRLVLFKVYKILNSVFVKCLLFMRPPKQ